MNVGSGITALRKDAGISQESLAGELGVSRQAVTKWESGESLPELDNLVAIASFFGVTVDSLLRPASCSGDSPAAEIALSRRSLSVPLHKTEAFAVFLCRAKRETYAGKGAETVSSRVASHDLAFEEGDYSYYDTYLGGEAFSGEEAVWYRSMPIWTMNYCGRVLLSDLFPSDFLKEALSLVPLSLPFRGPRVHERGEFAYHCLVTGDTDWFQGTEEILVRGVKTYECMFHGGVVRQ